METQDEAKARFQEYLKHQTSQTGEKQEEDFGKVYVAWQNECILRNQAISQAQNEHTGRMQERSVAVGKACNSRDEYIQRIKDTTATQIQSLKDKLAREKIEAEESFQRFLVPWDAYVESSKEKLQAAKDIPVPIRPVRQRK